MTIIEFQQGYMYSRVGLRNFCNIS